MADESAGKIKIELEADANELEQGIEQAGEKISSSIQTAFQTALENALSRLNKIGEQTNKIANDIGNKAKEESEVIKSTTEKSTEEASKKSRKSLLGVFDNFHQKAKTESTAAGKAISGKMIQSAADIKAAFDMAIGSVRTLLSKSKELMSAYQTQIEAEARLSATMRNTTGASKEQIQSVKDLAGEIQGLGVIGDEVSIAGMQELATYIENVDSLKTMMPVLDDMIAQQYGYSASTDSAVTISTMLGKVLQGQTSALSRYGYSFDKAQEKILKYGTEEERVATLAEVISQSVGGVNKALANTPTGKMKQLDNDFGDLKEHLGNLVTNVLAPIAKWLDIIILKLNDSLSKANEFVKKIMNIQEVVSGTGLSNISETAADSTENINSATKAAEKLKKTVAGFDQLNILSSDDSDSDSDSADSQSSTGSTAAIIPEPDTSKAESAIDRIGIKLGSLRDKLREIYDTSPLNDFVGSFNEQFNKIDFSGIVNNFQGIMQNLKPIVQSYLNGTGKILTSKMKLFGTIIGSIIRTVTNILQTITGGINQSLGENKGKISSFITTITGNVSNGIDNINRLISTISNALNDSLERMRSQTQDSIATMLGGFTTFSGTVGTITSEAFSIATKTIADWAADNEDKIGEFFDNVQGIFNHTMTTIGEVFDDAGKTIDNIWNNGGRQMWEGICQIVTDLGDIFIDTFNNHITPIVNGFVDLLKSAWTDMLQPFFDSVGNALTKLFNEIIKPLWDNILKPLFAWIVDKIFTRLKQQFERVKGFFQGIFEAVGNYLKGLWDSFSGFIDFIKGIFTGNWEQAWNGIKGIFNGISNSIKGIVNGIKNAFLSVWKSIEDHWKRAGDFFGNVWTAISGAFKGAKDWLIEQFTKAWDGIKSLFTKGGEFFEGIAESIGEVFTNTVNSLIDGINWVIAQPFNALNDALGGIKNVGIGGIKPFDWIETIPVPQIPKLAAGGLVTAPTLAMVGDNKGASHDPEVVAPLSKLQGMIGSSNPEIIGLLSKIIGLLENEESVYQNVIYLDSEAIERKLVKVRKRKQRRYGGAST